MISLHLILTVVPLAWALGPIGLRPYLIQKGCPVDCELEGLPKCECENINALRCTSPNEYPIFKDCPPRIGYPTAPKPLKTETSILPIATDAPPKITPTPLLPPDGSPSPIYGGPRHHHSRPPHPDHPGHPPAQAYETQICGSLGRPPCPSGQTCVDNPFRPDCYTALDCPGYCARLDDSICGPVYEVACPLEQQVCVTDPRKGCFGEGCPGTCVFLFLAREGIA